MITLGCRSIGSSKISVLCVVFFSWVFIALSAYCWNVTAFTVALYGEFNYSCEVDFCVPTFAAHVTNLTLSSRFLSFTFYMKN